MKKYLMGSLALALAIGFSAFTKPSVNIVKGKRFDTGTFWYTYTSSTQTEAERKKASNYANPASTETTCSGSTNECAVRVVVTLDAFGNPPANPDFTNVTFQTGTGFPVGGTAFVDNHKKS